MKKLISLIGLLIILGGAFFYSQEGRLPNSIDEVQQMVMKTPAKKQVGTAVPADLDKWTEYCESSGGFISEQEVEGNLTHICNTNDGLDGIRCQAKLFYEKTCGHGDPAPLKVSGGGEELTMHLNTDPSSNIPFVVLGPDGQKIVAFKKAGSQVIDKLVFDTPGGEQGVVTMGANGLPATLELSGTTLTYSNYTDTTVDILITRPDGSTETIENNPIAPQASLIDMLVPTAYALGGFGDIQESIKQANDAAIAAGNKPPVEMDFYAGTGGQILGVLGCGANVGIAVASGGSLAPMAYLGCGALATRVITVHTEIGPCQGDVLECAKDAVFAWIKGTTLKGTVKNAETGKNVKGATIKLHELNGKLYSEDKSNVFGSYDLSKFGDGIFIMQVTADEMNEARYKVNSLAQKRLLITNMETGATAFDSGIAETPKDFKFEFRFNPELTPIVLEEELEEVEEGEFSGVYVEGIYHQTTVTATEQGATVVTNQEHLGEIKLTVSGSKATCVLSTETTFKTSINGTGSGEGVVNSGSNNCSGTVDDNGNFTLNAEVTGTLRVPNQAAISIDSTLPISGKIEDGKMSGQLEIPNADPVPFGK